MRVSPIAQSNLWAISLFQPSSGRAQIALRRALGGGPPCVRDQAVPLVQHRRPERPAQRTEVLRSTLPTGACGDRQ
eukprot:6463745-Alexandrium_andersonii.AAC.1